MHAWLVDYAREGSGKGSKRPLGCPLNARFGVQQSVFPPAAYYKGPMTFKQALSAKKWLERCWGRDV